MKRLFDIAVEEILSCPELTRNGVSILPKRVAQYLLFLSCHSLDHERMTHIIQHWPHRELSFAFLSNPLCVSTYERCLSAHEYYSTCCSDLIVTSTEFQACVPSIAKGLFLHFSSQTIRPHLEIVDLSGIMVSRKENVDHLLRLARGEYPVSHPSDYVSSGELTRVYRQSRPVYTPPSRGAQPHLIVSMKLASPAQVDSITDLFSGGQHFKVEISCCDLSSLGLSHISRFLSPAQSTVFSNVTIHSHQVSDLVEDCEHPPLSSKTVLSLLTNSTSQPRRRHGNHLQYLLTRCDVRRIEICVWTQSELEFATSLIDPLANISSFTLKAMTQSVQATERTHALPQFIERNQTELEYFKIDACLTLIPRCVETLQQCARLRVLSVTQAKHRSRLTMDCTPSAVFTAIRALVSLEYFEWLEEIVLRTGDVVSMYQTLCHSLPRLQHLHLYGFNVLLSTTDLVNPGNELVMELLLSLLAGKEGDERVSTYKFPLRNNHFKHYTGIVRPDVCLFVEQLEKKPFFDNH